VDIGKRLRELRKAKGLSQRDIEDRTGLPKAYISIVENGRTTPTLQMLVRWAEALDVELYQLFAVGHDQPVAAESPERTPVGAQERTLLGLFGQMPADDRALLISLARESVKRKSKQG
jgi:transcriptional regulator with XRE-family HTH domain